MADLSDVTETLRSIVSAALYPVPPTMKGQLSVAGVPVGIQVGWPSPQSVDDDRVCGNSTLSIYPLPHERNVTRYPKQWQQIAPLWTPTFALSSTGQNITVSGIRLKDFFPQNLAVFINGKSYIHTTNNFSQTTSIATAIAKLIAVDVPATSASGNTISIPDGAVIGNLRVGTSAKVGKEVRRQIRTIQFLVLSPTPDGRNAIVKVFDPLLANMERFDLPDGFGARLLYRGSPFNDFDQKFGLFRRDVLYDVEYPTTLSDLAPEAIAARIDVSQAGADGSTITPPIISKTV